MQVPGWRRIGMTKQLRRKTGGGNDGSNLKCWKILQKLYDREQQLNLLLPAANVEEEGGNIK